MKKRIGMALAGATTIAVVCFLLAGEIPAVAQIAPSAGGRECPYVLNLSSPGVRVEIEDVVFTTVVEGTRGRRMRLKGDALKKFRLAVVTLKITKPAGQRLSLAAADLTLHYYHGDQTEATCAEALSYFSATNGTDRPMAMPPSSGPGFVKQTTGARATRASVVYCDVVFGYMEPDSREMWICVAQPSTVEPAFVSNGWRP